MRFYEFADTEMLEDLEAALNAQKKQLKNQSKMIANRKEALKNRQARDANRDAVAKMATNSRNAK